ncbi:MAG: hypothetical protein AABW92_01810 [Nanoarchaeota archaeon]
MTGINLPYNIRYALKYNEGMITKEDMVVLCNKKFEDVALYLVLKGLNHEVKTQKSFLEEVVKTFNNGHEMGDVLLEYVGEMKAETVLGTKLAQISRIGFEKIRNIFFNGADYLYQNNHSPILTAYSASLGLIPFLEHMPDEKETILILPSYFDTHEMCGYTFMKKSSKLSVDFLRDTDDLSHLIKPTFVDETIRDGKTMEIVVDFWNKKGWPKIVEGRYISNVFGHEEIRGIPLYSLQHTS